MKASSGGRVTRRILGALVLGVVVWVLMPVQEPAEERRAMVTAVAETTPVPHSSDAADDPAIWIHPTRPDRSVVIGSDKRGGLGVYDLAGQQIQFITTDRFNNVDVRYGFSLAGTAVDIVVAGGRTVNGLVIFRIDPADRKLVEVGRVPLEVQPVGTCLYHDRALAAHYAFVTTHDGEILQFRLSEGPDRSITGEQVRTFRTRTYPTAVLESAGFSAAEGCVADDETGYLYLAEEDFGLWKIPARPDTDADARVLVQAVGSVPWLQPDIEGVAIYHGPGRRGYLIVSNQFNDSFVILRRDGDHGYVGTFRVGGSAHTDRVTHTDGIEVVSGAVSAAFPSGLFIAQDDDNAPEHQNFKLVSWDEIAEAFRPPLMRHRSWDPRKASPARAIPGNR